MLPFNKTPYLAALRLVVAEVVCLRGEPDHELGDGGRAVRRRDEAAAAAGAPSAGGRGRRERPLASVVVDDVVELLGGLAQLDLVELAPHPLPPRRNA